MPEWQQTKNHIDKTAKLEFIHMSFRIIQNNNRTHAHLEKKSKLEHSHRCLTNRTFRQAKHKHYPNTGERERKGVELNSRLHWYYCPLNQTWSWRRHPALQPFWSRPPSPVPVLWSLRRQVGYYQEKERRSLQRQLLLLTWKRWDRSDYDDWNFHRWRGDGYRPLKAGGVAAEGTRRDAWCLRHRFPGRHLGRPAWRSHRT